MCLQNFITIFHSVQEIGPFSLFQNLELGKTSTDENRHFAISWARSLSISMLTQKSIKIFHSVQEIRPFSFVHNLALSKASTDDKCHFAIVSLFSEFEPRQKLTQSQMSFDNLMGYILSISMCMQNFITIFHSVQEIAPLSLFFRIWSSAKPRPKKSGISQSLGLDLVNINVYAKVYQTIPLSSRDSAIFTFSEFGARQSLDR